MVLPFSTRTFSFSEDLRSSRKTWRNSKIFYLRQQLSVIFSKYSFTIISLVETHIFTPLFSVQTRSFSKEGFFQYRFRNRLLAYFYFLNILLTKKHDYHSNLSVLKEHVFLQPIKMFLKDESSSCWGCWSGIGWSDFRKSSKNLVSLMF